ncbi:hypothetical protein Tco_0730149 [Tanacetum coccineum]|uniref:ParB/Sulfiredoxin domain-containing protein n=1 Tax=Tanacetum coccineum TaxID=301880 RepID=A0ABQ4YU24_9ASTR
MKNVNTFVPIETKDRRRASKLAAGSSQATITDSAEVGSFKRGAEVGLDHKGSKKQKTNEASESVQEQRDEEAKELPQEDLQQMVMVVPVEEVYVEALQVKYPIIDWEVYSKDTRRYWKIIRDLVKERLSTTEPTYDKEKELWVKLKRLFEPDSDDTLWKLQRERLSIVKRSSDVDVRTNATTMGKKSKVVASSRKPKTILFVQRPFVIMEIWCLGSGNGGVSVMVRRALRKEFSVVQDVEKELIDKELTKLDGRLAVLNHKIDTELFPKYLKVVAGKRRWDLAKDWKLGLPMVVFRGHMFPLNKELAASRAKASSSLAAESSMGNFLGTITVEHIEFAASFQPGPLVTESKVLVVE